VKGEAIRAGMNVIGRKIVFVLCRVARSMKAVFVVQHEAIRSVSTRKPYAHFFTSI